MQILEQVPPSGEESSDGNTRSRVFSTKTVPATPNTPRWKKRKVVQQDPPQATSSTEDVVELEDLEEEVPLVRRSTRNSQTPHTIIVQVFSYIYFSLPSDVQTLIKHLSFQTTTDPTPNVVESDTVTTHATVNSPAPPSPHAINESSDPQEAIPIEQSVQGDVPSIPETTNEQTSTTATSSVEPSQPEPATSIIPLEQPLITSTEISQGTTADLRHILSINAPQQTQLDSTQIVQLPHVTPTTPPPTAGVLSADSPQYQTLAEVLAMKNQNPMEALRRLQQFRQIPEQIQSTSSSTELSPDLVSLFHDLKAYLSSEDFLGACARNSEVATYIFKMIDLLSLPKVPMPITRFLIEFEAFLLDYQEILVWPEMTGFSGRSFVVI